MNARILKCAVWLCGVSAVVAQGVPKNIRAESVPEIPKALVAAVQPYIEKEMFHFTGWHPQRRQMLLIGRKAADSVSQLYSQIVPTTDAADLVGLTTGTEPVRGAQYRPGKSGHILFSRDEGGNEFYQYWLLKGDDTPAVRLTDGKSRNTQARWSPTGRLLVYMSTKRNGRDNDLYVMNVDDPKSERRLAELAGGGWGIEDWSSDELLVVLRDYRSINESHLHLCDAKTGALSKITPAEVASYGQARFSNDSRLVFYATDEGSEYLKIEKLDLMKGKGAPFLKNLQWDVEAFELSPDGRHIAVVTNEDGSSHLRIAEVSTGAIKLEPKLPPGVISSLEWHSNSSEVAFSHSWHSQPGAIYSIHLRSGEVEDWTIAAQPGGKRDKYVEPSRVKRPAPDGVTIPWIIYRPDAEKFPGKRPVVINIHGGPEGQSRPTFIGRNNYLINEAGIAIVYPNVRGSSGYGKTYLKLDNGTNRLSAVHDINVVMNWIREDPSLDGDRIGVMGGSYGGYMTLACMVEYNNFLRCGIDIVGISNFVTFLKNTQDYRRDLRRVEYGDERDPVMRAFLEKISPLNNVADITRPLMVVQGKNDPRVPVTESEQMVKALRTRKIPTWYVMAEDEGHGFRKRANQDYQFLATLLFLQEHLQK
ncbi:MAG: S9 family peptidase [Pedosphaera sp.]|nr:S9 family peptidase [Pedosphaera sp.]